MSGSTSNVRHRTITTKLSLKWISGIFFTLLIIVVCFTVGKCPTNSQTFAIYVLTAFAFAFLLPRSTSKSSFTYKLRQVGFDLSGGVALAFALMYVNPIDSFTSNACSFSTITATVFVHGKEGLQNLILRGKGNVIMDVNNERKSESISENGVAFFPNVHIGDSVRLNIDFSEPYLSTKPDSIYIIPSNGKLYLEIYLKGLNEIEGHILFKDSPLAGVYVQMDNIHAISDSFGYYHLIIPDSLQASKYEVWFSKKGFQSKSSIATPQTGQPLNINMNKENTKV